MKTAFVDVDDVVCSLVPIWLELYNRDYNDNVVIEDITEWSIHKFVKCGKSIYDYLRPEIYNQCVPVPGALLGIDRLRELGWTVFFATAFTIPENFAAKVKWLKHWKMIRNVDDVIGICHKGLLRGDLLIDDGPHNLKDFFGKKILFNMPWNQYHDVSPVVRANDWWDVIDALNFTSPVI